MQSLKDGAQESVSVERNLSVIQRETDDLWAAEHGVCGGLWWSGVVWCGVVWGVNFM